MSNDKAQAAYGRTERPSFPEDSLTASERKALRNLDAQAKHREGWKSEPTEWTPVPARQHAAAPQFNDGPPVKATWGDLLAMISGAAVIVAILGGLYLEFAALAN